MRAGIKPAAIVMGLVAMTGVRAESLQIGYAEPAVITVAGTGSVKFEAYGREFSLELETNDRLTQGVSSARKASISRIRLLRGKLAGNPASWVRLTSEGHFVSGGIWDGTDLYLVARHRDVATYLTNPLAAGLDQTVVFRLADTTNFLPDGFCATSPLAGDVESKNGQAQYNAMVREFKLNFVAAPTDQLDLSLIADSAIVQAYSGPNDDINRGMLDALNLVDGIYDSQVGLMITASDLRPLAASDDPFTADDSSALLAQLRNYRSSIPAVQSKAVAHLLTARVLDGGETLGIANVSGACDATNGVSLTSVGPNGYLGNAFMIMAHELGHNLGASHDTPACGDTHIMWPFYSYVTRPTLSQCSLDQIKPFIAAHRGACITSPAYGDVAARVGTIASPLQTEPFTWPVYVKNMGTVATTNSSVNLGVRNHDPVDATPTQGSCTNVNNHTVCQLGTLAPGAEARVDMNFTINTLETLDLTVVANSANDRYESNNIVRGSTTVLPRATLDISVTPLSTNAFVGDIVEYTYRLAASGPRASRAVVFKFGGGFDLPVVSASATQGTCSASECALGDIPTGATATVTVRVKAMQGSTQTLSGFAEAPYTSVPQQSVRATLNATATYDLAIDSPGNQLLAVGVPFTLTIPIRANGTKPVSGGLFRMVFPGAVIDSFTIDGTPCALNLLLSAQGSGCPIGTMNPGDVRVARLTAVFNAPYETGVYIAAEILNDELWSNNSANLTFRATHGIDVTLRPPSGLDQVEGSAFDLYAMLRSQGALSAANVSATLDVPLGVRVLSATLPQGTCSVVNDRRVTCTLGQLTASVEPEMKVRVIGDEPASYSATWSIVAANDAVPGNNSFTVNGNIWPLADVGINPIPPLRGFVVDMPREFTVEVFTGPKRAVENVVVSLPSADGVVLEAVSTPVGTCVFGVTAPKCNLGTLPPNSLIRLIPRYRATRSGTGGSNYVSVSAMRDVDGTNNDASITMNTYEAGDTAVRVAATTVTGKVGEIIDLPRITIDTITRSYDLRFSVALPTFATLESISGNVFCAGTRLLDCYLRGQSEAGTSDSIDLKVKLDAAGTFSTEVVARVANDTQPGNDGASFQVTATSVATQPPPSSGGGSSSGKSGGGGRFEWLALAFLALLGAYRARRARLQPRVMSRH